MGMRQRRGPAAASYPPLRLVLLVCACVEPLCAEPEPRAPLDDFSFIAPYDDINPFTGERLFLLSSRAEPLVLTRAVGGARFAPFLLTTRATRSFVVTGQRMIPQWDLGGTATAHRSFVRLTAEAQGSKGWMTCHQPLTLPEWSATLELRASGASPHLYGDGLAIWLTKASDHIEGPVFACVRLLSTSGPCHTPSLALTALTRTGSRLACPQARGQVERPWSLLRHVSERGPLSSP